MNKLPQLSVLLAMTLLGVSHLQAEQSSFITPEQSEALSKSNKPQASENTPTVATVPATTTASNATLGYLGIGFNKIPASIRAHLPSNITAQQGLIVTRFADNSSAADDGMKVHDILLSYDGQVIAKPEDFIQKIRKDKPGRIVTFTLVRQGEVLTIPITMGMQKNKKTAVKVSALQAPASYQMPAGKPAPHTNFNGLAIRRIGQDIYDASIGIIGQDGKPQRRSYKGNRMQILQQIMQDKSLPPQARQQLLFAVQPKQKSSNNWGGMPTMPFGNNNGFNPNQFFKGWNW
ncbi:MAG: PDZ domain-containing protein [Cocleimonas sp.]|nr:PDZ domain-containing protein [Cocleimonas sp.]